jgi:hypothetical protein
MGTTDCTETSVKTTILRYVTFQKSEDLKELIIFTILSQYNKANARTHPHISPHYLRLFTIGLLFAAT